MNYQTLFNALNDLGCPPPVQTEMDDIIQICEHMSPRVQASEQMYLSLVYAKQALQSVFGGYENLLAGASEDVQNAYNAICAALALADNTSELLPCPHSCGPSDWYEGGKCDENGCFFKTNETT